MLFPLCRVFPQRVCILISEQETQQRGDIEKTSQKRTSFSHPLDRKHLLWNIAEAGLVEREFGLREKDRDSGKNTGLGSDSPGFLQLPHFLVIRLSYSRLIAHL